MAKKSGNIDFPITNTQVHAYKIPTEEGESDGTFKWDHTVLVLVQVEAGNCRGLGYSYANAATAFMVGHDLFPLLQKENALDNTRLWQKMVNGIRNLGRPGISSMAIAAVDNALWDLKAKLLNLPLCKLLGQVHDQMPIYASGGFTSYGAEELSEKFNKLREEGHSKFKMKIGRNKKDDLKRLAAAREAIGDNELFVDANGAYYPKEALAMAEEMTRFRVRWFEEPVTSDNLEGLHMVREHAPASMDIAAGEYGYSQTYFHRMLREECVDVLQADATRCAGITGLLAAHGLCEAHHLPLSAHCAPSLHLHPALALQQMVHVEYFRDHVRIEKMLFDGAATAKEGKLYPDLDKNGMGLEFKFQDAEKFRITL